MRKYEIWCEKHTMTGNIMVAVIKRLKTEGPGVFEIKIDDIIYQKGYPGWHPGSVTTLAESDLKSKRETIKFMFEEISG